MSERQIGRRKYYKCTECDRLSRTLTKLCHYGIAGYDEVVLTDEAAAEHNQDIEVTA